MCVKDPSSGKWIDCHPTGSRPSDRAARASLEKAAEATGRGRGTLREAEESGEVSPSRITFLKESLSKKVDKQAIASFAYQTTDEGRAELAAEVAAAEKRSQEAKDEALAGGPSSSANPGFNKWFDGDARHEASRMAGSLRVVDGVREQQDAAVSRHKEVKAGRVGPQASQALLEAQSQKPTTVSTQDSNGRWHKSTQIGVVAVDESFEARQQYETAAWNTTHQVKPGIYPVTLTYTSDGRPDSVVVRYDTTIINDHTPSLYGGVPIGGPDRSRERAGQDGTHHVSSYAFAMPGSYTPGLKAFGGSLVLHDGVVMERETMRSPRDGRISNLTRFSFKEEPERLPDVEDEYRRSRMA